MPTYFSSNIKNVTIRESGRIIRIKPGDNELGFYIQNPPSNITFKSHSPIIHPFDEIFNSDTFPSESFDVYFYSFILIQNDTDDECIISANENPEDKIYINQGMGFNIDNTKALWGSIKIESAGVGKVKIWGIR